MKNHKELNSKTTDVFIVMQEGSQQYYLMKIEKRNYDVYCFLPHLGVHQSLHESGESHFRYERKSEKPTEQPPVALIMGEAGTPIGGGFKVTPLKDLGRASCVCTLILSIEALSNDFQKFDRTASEIFVIDTGLFPTGTKVLKVGIWAVPGRNKASFEFNNPNIAASMLYKVVQCEPQIWIYARPS
jgi:hypothetical protein